MARTGDYITGSPCPDALSSLRCIVQSRDMGAPSRRQGKPLTSPRHLTLRHGRRKLNALKGNDAAHSSSLAKGWESLYSSDVPGIQAGGYVASASQTIKVSDEHKLDQAVETPQHFRVLGPRFTLPSDAIYSVYPPPDHEVPHEVLPHVVFNDPTMPWERRIVTKPEAVADDLNTVPWLALLAFTPEELAVSKGDLDAAFSGTSIAASVAQNESMAVETPIADILKLNGEKVVKLFKDTNDSVSKQLNVLLTPKDVFNAVFAKYDDNGKRVATNSPYITRQKYLAHMRKINVEGMTTADDHETDTDREFGILIGNRTGPLSDPKPAPVIVHLVSLEGVDSITPFSVTTSFVGMVSLYSWRYTVQPPGSFDLHESFQGLAKTQGMLRPAIPAPTPDLTLSRQRVLQRLKDGYALSRYRLQTGEETVALFRGPLVPTYPVKPKWDLLSPSGSDLHIVDMELGVLDITYSSAWQLGRTLALADRPFATALTRVRREIAKEADNIAQVKLLDAADRPFKSKIELATTLESALHELSSLSKAEDVNTRWSSTLQSTPSLSRVDEGVYYFMEEGLKESAQFIAGADTASREHQPYNEFNTPRSVDWALVLKFVMDLYHLSNVPPHYLFTDPSVAPLESLRFFVIDQAWIDACVDGALSLGNHSSRDRDSVRQFIKDELNVFLTRVDPDLGYKPPVPRLGFVLRSEVVQKFPDLQIGVVNTKSRDPTEAPKLVRTTQLAEGMLMGFLSEAAVGGPDEVLTFTVPAHQQYFTAATEICPQKINMSYKRIYTKASDDGPNDRNQPIAKPFWDRGSTNPDGRLCPFVWGSDDASTKNMEEIRLLLVENLARNVQKTLENTRTKDGKVMYDEVGTSSAMMGIQLNSPAWQLRVTLPDLIPPPDWSRLSNARAFGISGAPPVEKRAPKFATQMYRTDKGGGEMSAPYPRKPPPHHQGVVVLSDDTTTSRRTSASSWSMISSKSPSDHSHHASQTSFDLLPELGPPQLFAPPSWQFRVWAADSPRDPNVKMLKKRQDLIFSIVVDPKTVGDFLLERADVFFDMDGAAALMNGYYGAGASMVSNLRFNVRLVTDGKQFKLPILPRSTVVPPGEEKPRVPVKKAKEISVFLPGVMVKCAKVEVDVKFTLALKYIVAPVENIVTFVKLLPQPGGCQ